MIQKSCFMVVQARVLESREWHVLGMLQCSTLDYSTALLQPAVDAGTREHGWVSLPRAGGGEHLHHQAAFLRGGQEG